MKVLQINSGHYRRGGADVVYLNTTDLLREKGHEVMCFSLQDEKICLLRNPLISPTIWICARLPPGKK